MRQKQSVAYKDIRYIFMIPAWFRNLLILRHAIYYSNRLDSSSKCGHWILNDTSTNRFTHFRTTRYYPIHGQRRDSYIHFAFKLFLQQIIDTHLPDDQVVCSCFCCIRLSLLIGWFGNNNLYFLEWLLSCHQRRITRTIYSKLPRTTLFIILRK